MAVSGLGVAMTATGGLLLYTGIKGASFKDVLTGVTQGSLSGVSDTNTISGSSPASIGGSGSGTPGSDPGAVASGSSSQNYTIIANYLVGQGYSKAAAAGIVGCIAGESSGNPEAVGDQGTSFGLIQEHGSQYSGLVTGNASKDLQSQLPALVAYNNAQGARNIQMLNAIPDPVEAAKFYSQYFERPLNLYSDVNESVARSVYAEITKGTA